VHLYYEDRARCVKPEG